MRLNGRHNSIAFVVALPFAIVLWQGSSCRSSNANSNGNTMSTNTSTASQSRDLRGTWGGQNIAMEVTDEVRPSNTTARTAASRKRLLPRRTESSKLKEFTSASAADLHGKVRMTVSLLYIGDRSRMTR